jgi:hypothetical protein
MKKIAIVLTVLTGFFELAFASDWSAFRGDQQRSGYNADSVISADSLTTSWNTKILNSFINTSQPIIDNRCAYA